MANKNDTKITVGLSTEDLEKGLDEINKSLDGSVFDDIIHIKEPPKDLFEGLFDMNDQGAEFVKNFTGLVSDLVSGIHSLKDGVGNVGKDVGDDFYTLLDLIPVLGSSSKLIRDAYGTPENLFPELFEFEDRVLLANLGIADSYIGVLDGINNYREGVANASGTLKLFSEDSGVLTAEQLTFADTLKTTHEDIKNVYKNASEAGHKLNEEEIEGLRQHLESTVAIQQETAEAEQAYYSDRSVAVAQWAADTANATETTASEFALQAEIITATAEDTYNQRIAAAELFREQQLEELDFERLATQMTGEEYDARKVKIEESYQGEVTAAQAAYDETNAILSNGYAQRAEGAQQWVDTSAEINEKELEIKQRYNDLSAEYWQEYNELCNSKDATEEERNAARTVAIGKQNTLEEDAQRHLLALEEEKVLALQSMSSEEIGTLLGMVTQSEGAYNNLNDATRTMIDQLLLDMTTLPEPARAEMNKTLDGMNLEITNGGKLVYKNGEHAGEELVKGWAEKNADIVKGVSGTFDLMNIKMGDKDLDSPNVAEISDAEKRAYSARQKMADVFSSPIYQNVHVTTTYSSSYGRNASGGVTGYAKGGVNTANPKISKHAAGVFTKRTRLWDPITGINEYGEAGHEALLPLKESVFNEIARGITRQLSPAKLSGLMSQLKSAVQGEMSEISVQMTASSDYSQSSVKSDRMIDRLTGKMDAILDKLEGLASLSVLMDGQKVGKLVTATVNAGLNDIYSTNERSKF